MNTLQKNVGLVWLLVMCTLVGFGWYLVNWMTANIPSREIVFATTTFNIAAGLTILALRPRVASIVENYQTRPNQGRSK